MDAHDGIVGMESARPCGLLILLIGSSPHFTPACGPIHLRASTSGQESFRDLDRQPWHSAFDRHRFIPPQPSKWFEPDNNLCRSWSSRAKYTLSSPVNIHGNVHGLPPN